MSSNLTLPARIYRNHHLDSTRWDAYEPRDDDIVISTSLKSGTTWTQSIVRELIVHAMMQTDALAPARLPPDDNIASIWVDARYRGSVAEMHQQLQLQPHRRFLKTHLPLDGLPLHPQVQYIVVGRDPRDVFMSLWNHYSDYKDEFYARLNGDPDLPGEPLPRCPENIHHFWQDWICRGWFEWEQEGYPFWGNMHHAQTWWEYRHLGNILFVHYADLLADRRREITRIAHFLGIELTDAILDAVVEHTQLTAMRRRGEERDRQRQGHHIFRGGSSTFFNKGTNGRWQEILTGDELAMYEETKSHVLTPDCARWLEHGQVALDPGTLPN
jgi:aryl sulfotransferase